MIQDLYPIRFEPLFKSMLWGGDRLRPLLNYPPCPEPTGEAWLLSDVPGSESRAANGPFQGRTLHEIMAHYGPSLLGTAVPVEGRFPLLLKLIDARQELSVQVHPNDEQARRFNGRASGKTEAWVVLHAEPSTSRIYAGFRNGTDETQVRQALEAGTLASLLHQFTPRPGDCIFLPAGTVHAIGANILLFEIQQTSDVTYRLHDWNRIDARTGRPRELHIEAALACADFLSGPRQPIQTEPDGATELLVMCDYFYLWRHTLRGPTLIGQQERMSLIVCIHGRGSLDGEPVKQGDTLLYPACLAPARAVPHDDEFVLLESAIPPRPPC